MTKGPSFVIYILDKSEQTAGKLAKQSSNSRPLIEEKSLQVHAHKHIKY